MLVNDLLFIARQGAGAARLNLQPIDLGNLVEKVCGDARVIAHAKAVDIAFASADEHEMVRGDPARLRQLFLVLLDNAVRYSKTKGAVKVDIGRVNGEVTVRVTDRGIGIAPEELDGIFERFRRGGNAASMNDEGSGSVFPWPRQSSRRIKEGSRWRAGWAKGRPSRSHFRPRARRWLRERAPGRRRAARRRFHRPRPARRESRGDGCAPSGGQEVELAKTGEFDVIVLDLMLPDMHGYDVCQRIRLEGDHTPILMLTAMDAAEDKIKGLKAGADDYL